MDPFVHRVRAALRDLDPPPGPWLVAVSGGADSTALACALRAAEPAQELVLAHLDHGWRGPAAAQADRDAAAALARRLGLPLVSGAVAAEPGEAGSLEAGARRARYAWLAEVARERGAAAIALGHTADDQLETVLWRLVRGTRLSGLGGIPPTRRLEGGATLLRPLLGEPRAEVVAYLTREGQPWREDPSNADPRFLRARLRQDVLPALRALNPALEDAVGRLAGSARDVDAWIAQEVRALGRDLALPQLPLAGFAELPRPVQERLLHDWLRPQVGARLDAGHVGAARRVALAGGRCGLPGGRELARDGEALVLDPAPAPSAPEPAELPAAGACWLPGWRLQVEVRLHPSPPPGWDEAPPEVAFLDPTAITGPLTLRGRRPGDRFWPLGSPGTRTLKRFYIERRIPRSVRDGVPVVTDRDRPVWVVGHRIDHRYRVTSATRSVLEIRTEASAGDQEEGTP
ncbi:MAG: tRNA lysidine(34) synthetase TilS [Planctomycetota bacterium]